VQRFLGMGDQIDFDERIAAQLEVVYRTRDIKRRRALAQEALAPEPGDEVLDVGCGPGFYVVDILDIVGANGSVTGVDASAAMLAIAGRKSACSRARRRSSRSATRPSTVRFPSRSSSTSATSTPRSPS
jgi:SAM-dependent methyltransferase